MDSLNTIYLFLNKECIMNVLLKNNHSNYYYYQHVRVIATVIAFKEEKVSDCSS